MPTNKQIRNIISKLELKEGDILVVRDADTLHRLRDVKMPSIKFPVPILYAPLGIEKIDQETLKSYIHTIVAPSIIRPK